MKILITGASGGIGRQTAYKLATKKHTLILTYHSNKYGMTETVRTCQNLGARDIVVVRMNLLNDSSIDNLVSTIKDTVHNVDVLINNAATIVWETISNQTYNDIELQLRTNLEGTIKLTHSMLPLIEKKLINIGSKMSKEVRSDLPVYCASKFGLRGFTLAIAEQYKNISVFLVNPGLTATKMTGFKGDEPKLIANKICKLVESDNTHSTGIEIDLWQ